MYHSSVCNLLMELINAQLCLRWNTGAWKKVISDAHILFMICSLHKGKTEKFSVRIFHEFSEQFISVQRKFFLLSAFVAELFERINFYMHSNWIMLLNSMFFCVHYSSALHVIIPETFWREKWYEKIFLKIWSPEGSVQQSLI